VPEQQDKPVDKPNLADQYELDDHHFDPALDADVDPVEPRTEAASQEPASDVPVVRDRDPETGRYLPLTPPAAQKPAHSRRLRQMAQELGIPQEEIDGTPPEALDDIVYHLHRQALAHTQQLRREGIPDQGQVPPGDSPRDSGPSGGTVTNQEEPDLGLDPNLYDGPLLQVLKDQAKQIRALTARLDRQEQQERVRVSETLSERIDRSFERHHDHLGKGKKSELAQDSADYLRRMAVLALVDRMGEREGSLESRIDKAVKTLYGERQAPPEAAEPDELKKRQEVWNGAAVARPTQRAGLPEPKGTQRAEKAVAKHLREKGISLDDMTEENGLPG
jgi:hypothetical protein